MTRKLKRRDFIKLSSVAVLGTVAAACAPKVEAPAVEPSVPPQAAEATKPPEAAAPTATTAAAAPVTPKKAGEPPMLADKVKSGALPPLAERLPDKPLVVADRQAIGTYGGEIRMVMFDPVWWVSWYDMHSDRMLTYSDMNTSLIVPSVMEGWEVTPDGKSWTFKMRKGMKWSDGKPITTEDVRFWWEDHMANKDINSSPWWQFRFGGENMKVDIIDEFTFRFTFAAPFGNFAAHMTRWTLNDGVFLPSHYLKQFHKKYTDEAKLVEAAKAKKLDTWVQYYNSKVVSGIWGGPDGVIDFPTFMAWHVVEMPKEGMYLWERNPYYWKVDTEGNQLPYIDKARLDYAANTEVTKLKIAQSELDIVGMHDVTIMEYPYYKDNEAKANYKVGDYISSMGDRVTFFPNHVPYSDTNQVDEVLAKIVQDYRFVEALSMAIDRDEINQSIFFGQARMGAMSPMPSSKYFKESYGTAFAKFDKDAANKLLDDMGLKKGSDGVRLRPDGKKLSYAIEHSGVRVGPAVAKISEMIAGYWRDIGLDSTAKEIQDSLLSERKTNSLVQCSVWHADRCTDMLLHIEPDWFIPVGHQGQGGPAPKWADWYVAADKKAKGLVEPPDDIKKLLTTFDQMTAVVDENERVKLGQQIFDYLEKNPLEVGLVLECPAPLLFNKNLRNLPKAKAYIGWDSYGQSTYHPEAYFYEGGKRA